MKVFCSCRHLVLTLCLFLSVLAHAQTPSVSATSSSQIAGALLPPPKIWLGTENGVNYIYRDPLVGLLAIPYPTPFKMEIITLDTNRPYFHWSQESDANRWANQNGTGLSDAEFEILRSNGDGQKEGGGFYISQDFTNSSGFGSTPTAVTLQKGLRVLEGDVMKFFPDATKFYQGNNPTQWATEQLEKAGIEGAAYSYSVKNGTAWINLFVRSAIAIINRATFDDFLRVAGDRYNSIEPWIILASKANLNPNLSPLNHCRELSNRVPFFGRLLAHEFIDADRIMMSETLQNNSYLFSNLFDGAKLQVKDASTSEYFKQYSDVQLSDLSRYLKSETSRVIEEMLAKPDGVFKAYIYSDFSYFQAIQRIYDKTLAPFKKTAETTHFPQLLNTHDLASITTVPFSNNFIMHYYLSFAFIDLADRLKAEVEGNTSVWTLYDGSNGKLYDNWVNLRMEIANFSADRENQANVSLGNKRSLQTGEQRYFMMEIEEFKRYAGSLDQMKIIANRLSGGMVTDIRGGPVVAGGDYVVNQIHYYRITREELKNLEANPYLVVESVPVPNAAPGSNWVLARHEYPSARTYLRFKNKLSSPLVADLVQADQQGILKNPDDARFHSLTKRVLNELWTRVQLNLSPLDYYKSSISIHPFPDHNGRTMRFLYQLKNGLPLIFRNWDWDLFLSDADLEWERIAGQRFYGMLTSELTNLYNQNPSFPKAYDARSPYAYFFDNGELEKVSNPHYLDQARAFFKDETVKKKITQKLILENGSLETSECSNVMGGLLKN